MPALIAGGFGASRVSSGVARLLAFAIGGLVGYFPHVVAVRSDGYDAYKQSFATILGDEDKGIDWPKAGAMAQEHLSLLGRECLPRLVGGHRLPGFQSEPSLDAIRGRARWRDPSDPGVLPIGATVLGHLVALAGWTALLVLPGRPRGPASSLVRGGLIASSLAVVAGFIINLNIYNSDNYRYLVFLLVPTSVGFGLLGEAIARRGRGGRLVLGLGTLVFAGFMTLDTARWYRGYGWLDAAFVPVRRPLADPLLDWLRQHPESTRIYGGYWDVYRLAFLTGGRVRGTPYPNYPDRFPRFSDRLPAHRPRLLMARTDDIGRFNRILALREGGTVLAEGPGYAIIDWPRGDE
jgi:hypothetical protein